MGSYLAIKVSPTEMRHIKVPREVYVYVRQLENAIRRKSTREALRKLYPGRLSEIEED